MKCSFMLAIGLVVFKDIHFQCGSIIHPYMVYTLQLIMGLPLP